MSSTAASGLFFDPLAATGVVVPVAAGVEAPAPNLRGGQLPFLSLTPEKTHQPENRAASLQQVRRDLENLSRRQAAS